MNMILDMAEDNIGKFEAIKTLQKKPPKNLGGGKKDLKTKTYTPVGQLFK